MNFEILEVKGDVYITTHENIGEGDWFIRGYEIHRCFIVHKRNNEKTTYFNTFFKKKNLNKRGYIPKKNLVKKILLKVLNGKLKKCIVRKI
ncbi:MAG: hypothetical protein EBU01_05780 [Crocinitomicaceae bacterium]|nr:hypothetical protein [Crocinitomicaceae bacterium]